VSLGYELYLIMRKGKNPDLEPKGALGWLSTLRKVYLPLSSRPSKRPESRDTPDFSPVETDILEQAHHELWLDRKVLRSVRAEIRRRAIRAARDWVVAKFSRILPAAFLARRAGKSSASNSEPE